MVKFNTKNYLKTKEAQNESLLRTIFECRASKCTNGSMSISLVNSTETNFAGPEIVTETSSFFDDRRYSAGFIILFLLTLILASFMLSSLVDYLLQKKYTRKCEEAISCAGKSSRQRRYSYFSSFFPKKKKQQKSTKCNCRNSCQILNCVKCSSSCSYQTNVSSETSYGSLLDITKENLKNVRTLTDLDKLKIFFINLSNSHYNGLSIREVRQFAIQFGVPPRMLLSNRPTNFSSSESILAAQCMVKCLEWIHSKKLTVKATDVIEFFDEEMQMRGLADDMRLAAGYSPIPVCRWSSINLVNESANSASSALVLSDGSSIQQTPCASVS
ncbi:uncharacterized protein LOC143460547 [Clavelina lepadiformis]|uniref:uncharacterized protein LOC143460547 n=1 Tax=Clavelina lepadiformis TaxID=159417 RepID=UPI0040434B0D